MPTVLFLPLPEPGHILPTLPVARHLAARGHAVAYLTAPHFRDIVEKSGAQFISLLSDEAPGENVSGLHIWTLFAAGQRYTQRSELLARLISELDRENRYRLIFMDRLLARDPVLRLFEGSRDRILLFSTSLPNWNDSGPRLADVPTIVFCPEHFEVPKFRHGYDFLRYVEPSISSLDEIPFAFDQLDSSRPLILITFGTQSLKLTRVLAKYMLVAELAKRHPAFQFVMTIPHAEYRSQMRDVALNNLMILERVPQRLLLQKASVFITHGGLGGIKEAVMSGTPMVVMPSLHDQPYNAMRVRFHQLGEALFEESQSIQALESLVLEAASGKYQASLNRMQSYFAALEGSRLSHMLIEHRLESLERNATPGF
jgi:UDP:flavonoid glycosyltransferase YjiC (YdhE family)